MRRIALTLLVLGALLVAPAAAQAQSQDDPAFACLSSLLFSGGTLTEETERRCSNAVLGRIFPNMERRFCADCDPRFSSEEIRRALVAFDGGRALRTRLIECRDRRLYGTNSEDSLRECAALERTFELYLNDEGSLEARRRGTALPDANGPPGQAETGATVFLRRSQRLSAGVRVGCRAQTSGTCSVRVIARRRLFAAGSSPVAGGQTARVTARSTAFGRRVLRRVGRITVRVLVRTPAGTESRKILLRR